MNYIPSMVYMFGAIFAGLLLTLVTSQAGILIARRVGLVDHPGSAPHKQHSRPTPLAGGITLAITLPILVVIFGLWRDAQISAILLTAIVILFFGIWDDARGLSPLVKFIGQLVAAILLNGFDIYIRIFQSPDFFPAWNGPWDEYTGRLLTIIWVVGVTNAFNLADSMDGLCVGLSGWAFAFFMLATYDSNQSNISLLSGLFLGCCLGLNFYNASPAKLFMGDSGAQVFGFILAAIAILYSPPPAPQSSSWFIPILLVGVPIFDTTLVYYSRLRRGVPFYKGGLDHTYHRLVAFGLDPVRAVLTMHTAALLLECLAFIAMSLPPLYANFLFVVCLISGLVAIYILDHFRK